MFRCFYKTFKPFAYFCTLFRISWRILFTFASRTQGCSLRICKNAPSKALTAIRHVHKWPSVFVVTPPKSNPVAFEIEGCGLLKIFVQHSFWQKANFGNDFADDVLFMRVAVVLAQNLMFVDSDALSFAHIKWPQTRFISEERIDVKDAHSATLVCIVDPASRTMFTS